VTPIRIGLIGAGVIGRAHAAILAKLPPDQAHFVAIADPSEAGAALARSLGVQHFADAEAMLDGAKPDAAIIATPNVLHGPNAHACMSRGVAVLIEKPLAEDVATAQAIAEHAERSGVKLLVGHFRRHNPVLQAARRMVQEGQLGRLVAVAASSTVLKPDSYFDTVWRRQPGGGPILINLVHDIDALRFLCGEIETVQALVANEARGLPVEDTAAVLLRFRSGALATIMLSDATPSPFCWDQTAGENPTFPAHHADAYRISGTEGTLELPSLTLWRYPGQRGWDQRLVCETNAAERRDPLEQQTLHFLRVIQGEEAPLVSGWDGARTVAATLAVGRSVTERQPVQPEELTEGGE
jgi:predicted dehydrogenase